MIGRERDDLVGRLVNFEVIVVVLEEKDRGRTEIGLIDRGDLALPMRLSTVSLSLPSTIAERSNVPAAFTASGVPPRRRDPTGARRSQ